MKSKMKKQWILFVLVLGTINTYAQQELDSIKKEDVVVEFSFNPTLSDVFKLKTSPKSKEEFAKEKIDYKITSKKVSSDFVPITKKANYINIDGRKRKYHRNYIYGAAGLYGNGELEVMLRPRKVNGLEYGLDISSYNTQNGIDDKRVDNGQWKSNLGLFFAKDKKTYSWRANAAYQRNSIHWYGLNNTILEADYENKDVNQVYNYLSFVTDIKFKKLKVSQITPSLNLFFDDFKSTEVDFKVATVLDDVLIKGLDTKIDFEFLNGGFTQNYLTSSNIDYSFLNIGITPSYVYQTKDFQLKASVGLFMNADTEASKSKFFVLPSIMADIKLIESFMTLHVGNRGEFYQNTYESLASQNPFISPTLEVLASSTPVNAYLGLEGKLTKAISYNTEVSYKQIKDKALYQSNQFQNVLTIIEPFQLGNSFDVVYDDVNVFSLKGNMNITLTKQLSLGGIAIFNSYDLDTENKAWNLPNVEIETYVNYKLDKWFAQGGVNIVGGREDVVETREVDVDGLLDVNVKGGYKINRRLNAHVNFYNLLNSKYESFVNYKVQGFQATAGLSYKF